MDRIARIDLHAHTNRSDGSLAPAALAKLAADAGLRLLAVTDHDTTDGFAEAHAAGQSLGLEVVCGAEITARFPGRAMHLLAYGFERRERGFSEMLAEILAGRETRNPKILRLLAELGRPVTMDEVRAEASGDVIGRPHIARALVRKGYVPDTKTAFTQLLRDGGPAFVAAESVEPDEVVRTVRDAGGVTVLAHPRQLRVESAAGLAAVVEALVRDGLAGIEVDHPTQPPEERKVLRALAERLRIVASGGSDFHGDGKPHVRIGEGDGTIAVPYETWEALRARFGAR